MNSTCAPIDCSGAGTCEPTCTGASCEIDCQGAGTCKPTCSNGATCSIDCRGTNDCSAVVCEMGAKCRLRCGGGNQSCGFKSCGSNDVQQCPSGDAWTCGGAPCN
jgi:hypothetical protein